MSGFNVNIEGIKENITHCAEAVFQKVGSYYGKAVVWLDETSSGRTAQTVLYGAATAAAGIFSLYFAVNAVASTIFGLSCFMTVAGIPLGIGSLVLASGMALISFSLFELAVLCKNETVENYEETFRCAAKEARGA